MIWINQLRCRRHNPASLNLIVKTLNEPRRAVFRGSVSLQLCAPPRLWASRVTFPNAFRQTFRCWAVFAPSELRVGYVQSHCRRDIALELACAYWPQRLVLSLSIGRNCLRGSFVGPLR